MEELEHSDESELALGEVGARIVREETSLPVPFGRPDATVAWKSNTASDIDLRYDDNQYLWLEFVVGGVKYWTFDGSPVGIRKGMLFWPAPLDDQGNEQDDIGGNALFCFGPDRIRIWMPSGTNSLDIVMTTLGSSI